MSTAAALVAEELVGLSHELVRAVQEHDVNRLDSLLAAEFTLDGAAGTLGREELLQAASEAYAIDEFAYYEIDPEVYGSFESPTSGSEETAAGRSSGGMRPPSASCPEQDRAESLNAPASRPRRSAFASGL